MINNCKCDYCKKDLNGEDCISVRIEHIGKDICTTGLGIFCQNQCLIKYLQEDKNELR